MEVQVQTKQRITFTKQDVIAILQAHIDEQGYTNENYEVCGDNIPDQLVIDMISDVEVIIDTNNDAVHQTTQLTPKSDVSIDPPLKDKDALSKQNKHIQLDSMTSLKCSENMTTKGCKGTTITSEYNSTLPSPSIPKTYPKDWDPFAD